MRSPSTTTHSPRRSARRALRPARTACDRADRWVIGARRASGPAVHRPRCPDVHRAPARRNRASTGGGVVVAATSARASHSPISVIGRPKMVVLLGRVRTRWMRPAVPAITAAAKKLTQTSRVRFRLRRRSGARAARQRARQGWGCRWPRRPGSHKRRRRGSLEPQPQGRRLAFEIRDAARRPWCRSRPARRRCRGDGRDGCKAGGHEARRHGPGPHRGHRGRPERDPRSHTRRAQRADERERPRQRRSLAPRSPADRVSHSADADIPSSRWIAQESSQPPGAWIDNPVRRTGGRILARNGGKTRCGRHFGGLRSPDSGPAGPPRARVGHTRRPAPHAPVTAGRRRPPQAGPASGPAWTRYPSHPAASA